jgi:[acyl-carrier-protein] S-malonyltransferase
MGRAWAEHPSWELVAEVSDAAGRDVAHLLLDADAEELRATRNAQLATFTLSLVVLDAVERLGLAPAACAGHSLGEYTALVAGAALSLDDGVRLVVERGEAMQNAADEQPGTMAAVLGLDDDAVDAACRRADGGAWVANYNAPEQVVVAGTGEAVSTAGAVAKELGARKILPLKVGGAFHTPLMHPARDRLRKALKEASFRPPEVPITANVDAHTHPGADEWPGLLSAQLCSPVRWRQTLAQLVETGIEKVVELGPGGVLTGLARRSEPSLHALAVASPEDLDGLLDALAGGGHATDGRLPQGERLHLSERLVLSPATGAFSPTPAGDAAGAEGEVVGVGDLLGSVAAGPAGEVEVRSAFTGWLMGLMVMPGERVTAGQPVAWLQTTGAA